MTRLELVRRVLETAGDAPTGGHYSPASAVQVLDEAQRCFCFMTLCLEQISTLNLTANMPYYRWQVEFPDFIAPLRLRNNSANGAKLIPATVNDLQALNTAWPLEPGTPKRYASSGCNWLSIHPRPSSGGSSLSVTYARSPLDLLADSQSPEIPDEYHMSLLDYAVPRLRASEGGQEWEMSMPSMKRFWADVAKMALYTRTRNRAARYDTMPPEQQFFDGSRLIDPSKRKALNAR